MAERKGKQGREPRKPLRVPTNPDLLNAEQAGVILSASAWKVYNLASKGLLKSVRIGRKRFFHREELQRFLAEGGGTA